MSELIKNEGEDKQMIEKLQTKTGAISNIKINNNSRKKLETKEQLRNYSNSCFKAHNMTLVENNERKPASQVLKHSTQEAKNQEKMEKMQVPDGFQFSKANFTPRYWPEDEYPLMCNYSTLENRIKSFPESCDISAEDKDLLTNLGFYFIGPYRSGVQLIPSVACFCCGKEIMIYPVVIPTTGRRFEVVHHFNCTFFKLPDDKLDIKDSIKVIKSVADIDVKSQFYKVKIKGLELCNPSRTYLPYFEKKPLCSVCGKKEVGVFLAVCGHRRTCTPCAKSIDKCVACETPYIGLIYDRSPNWNENTYLVSIDKTEEEKEVKEKSELENDTAACPMELKMADNIPTSKEPAIV